MYQPMYEPIHRGKMRQMVDNDIGDAESAIDDIIAAINTLEDSRRPMFASDIAALREAKGSLQDKLDDLNAELREFEREDARADMADFLADVI